MCDVVERYPKYEFSGYTKTVAWIDQADKQLRKLDFFDRKGAPFKTLTLAVTRNTTGSAGARATC